MFMLDWYDSVTSFDLKLSTDMSQHDDSYEADIGVHVSAAILPTHCYRGVQFCCEMNALPWYSVQYLI